MLYQATIEEYDSIIAFYDDMIERTPDVRQYARWQKGKHPTAEGIWTYIQEGSMFLHKEQGTIVGAMALTMYQGEEYHAIEWSEQVPGDELATNTPAHKLYQRLGFEYRGKQNLYAENTGWTDFFFLEYK